MIADTTTNAIGQNPTTPKSNADPCDADIWTLRPPEDVRRLVARAMKRFENCKFAKNKSFWIFECIRAGLAEEAGKKDQAPILLKKASYK